MRSKILLLSERKEEQEAIIGLLAWRDDGADVEVADTLHRGLEILAGDRFDAVLFDLDIAVPDWQLNLRTLVASAGAAPVMVLSDVDEGHDDAGATAVHAGAHDYLVKPRIHADALRRIVRYAIERTQFQRKYERLARQNAERQRMEEAMRESQERIRTITEGLLEGVLVADGDGLVVFSNPSADSQLGNDQVRRIVGHYVDTIFLLREGARLLPFAEGPFSRVAETGQPWRDDDAVFELCNGRSLAVGYACSALVEDGVRKGIIISFRDIRSLKRAQQEALQASKLASVGQLAAGVAHEINTPIQYIGDNLRFLGGALETLQGAMRRCREIIDRHCPADAKDSLERFLADEDMDYLLEEMPQAITQSLDGVGQVARIVLAMKEFSHPGEREKVAVDLNKAIENTLAVSRNEWKHVAEMETTLAADLPKIMCLAGEMNQVLLNLVVNAAHAIQARQASTKGRIEVSTRHHGGLVDITVKDDGVGMSDAIRERIFDPFFTTKEVGKGTGQGLAICRDVVVSKHFGKITVDTVEGQGTTFTIRLPVEGVAISLEDDA